MGRMVETWECEKCGHRHCVPAKDRPAVNCAACGHEETYERSYQRHRDGTFPKIFDPT